MASSVLSTPATSQAQLKALATGRAVRRSAAAAPQTTSTAAAISVASVETARLPGSWPGPPAHTVAMTKVPRAASKGAQPRTVDDRGTAGSETRANAAQRAKAKAWFR